jgi:hypothetical protein
MDKNLFFKDIKEETHKYQRVLDKSQENVASPIELIKDTLRDNLKSIIITNLKFKDNKIFYVTRINHDKIELAERSGTRESNMVYVFIDGEVYFNKKKMNRLFRNSFIDRVRSIILDIEKQKASVYEERATGINDETIFEAKPKIAANPPQHNKVNVIKKSPKQLEIEAKRRRLREEAEKRKQHALSKTTPAPKPAVNVVVNQTNNAILKKHAPVRKQDIKRKSPNIVNSCKNFIKKLFK